MENLNTATISKYKPIDVNGHHGEKRDKHLILNDFCQLLSHNLVYKQGKLFSGKISGQLDNLSSNNQLDLLNHLKKCHMAINNNHVDVQAQDRHQQPIYDYLHHETYVLLRSFTALVAKSDDELSTAADNLLYLLAHTNRSQHYRYAGRFGILINFLQCNIKHGLLRKPAPYTRHDFKNWINITFCDDKAKLRGNSKSFIYDSLTNTIYNNETSNNIQYQQCDPHSNLRQERDPFIWFKRLNNNQEVFNYDLYFDEQNSISKMGKLCLYTQVKSFYEICYAII